MEEDIYACEYIAKKLRKIARDYDYLRFTRAHIFGMRVSELLDLMKIASDLLYKDEKE